VNPPEEPAERTARPGGLREPDAGRAHTTVVRWLSSSASLWIAGLWGMAEAALLFIVPDVWLGLVALFVPRRAPHTLAAIAVGAVVGATLLVGLTALAPSGVTSLLERLPGIGPDDLPAVRAELVAHGLGAFLNGPLQGLPVKLYVHEAALLGLAGPALVGFVVLNRIIRIGLVGLVAAVVGTAGRPLIARFPRLTVTVYLASWAVFYAAYFASRGP
jgi:hypothetical protein